MSANTNTIWATLLSVNLVEGAQANNLELNSPWYVKLLLALAGWFAAVFLLLFVGLSLENFFDNKILFFIVGSFMIIIAYIIFYNSKNDFAENFALAVSIAGQALIIFVIIDSAYYFDKQSKVLIIALFQIILTAIIPNYVHRLLTTLVAALLSVVYLKTLQQYGIPDIASSILLLLSAWLWLNEFKNTKQIKLRQAIAYGLTLALIILYISEINSASSIFTQLLPGSFRHSSHSWLSELLASVVAVYIIWDLLKRTGHQNFDHITILSLVGTLIFSAISLEAYGIIASLIIIVLGFANSNRVLFGLGIAAMLYFISAYYYYLQMSLVDKAQTLLIIGLCLLVLRMIMLRVLDYKKDSANEQ